MKWKSRGFWLKLVGGPSRKRLEIMKNGTCVYKGEYVILKEKRMGFLTKIDRGYPRKKAGKSRETQLVFMKGNMCT